jgi:Zn ribbon nucleic-acid-binding protein
MIPTVICPRCKVQARLDQVLTAQSNQNVIYTCIKCDYSVRNIETSKG